MMRDPFTWSLPLGRAFGIVVKVHLLFPLVALGLVMRVCTKEGVPPGMWLAASGVIGLLFVSVLLHEFGHCFGARLVDGDAEEILIWPLGGLAFVEVPHTPRANFVATVAGPLVNVLLCAISAAGLIVLAYRPPLNPFTWVPLVYNPQGQIGVELSAWDGAAPAMVTGFGPVVLARLFYLNWVLLLLNLLPGFPLDGGRMFQSLVWWRTSYRQGTMAAVFAGFLVMLVMLIFAIAAQDVLAFCLAVMVYVSCRQQWIILETGGEESAFGYDFSQGYTSLERDQPPAPPKRRQGWFKRWLQNRARRKLEREQEQRESEERRMDELLEKIQRHGRESLTAEEQRFLTRVSARYRNRQ